MAGVSAPSAIQASLQGVIDALNQGDCKEARRLLFGNFCDRFDAERIHGKHARKPFDNYS